MSWEIMNMTSPNDIVDFLKASIRFIGDAPDRKGLIDTPCRIMRSWKELFSGYQYQTQDQYKDMFTMFDSDGRDEIIVVKDIQVYSMCEHHWLPFVGKAHVGYIPYEKIAGVSKIARLVDVFARRFQIQERLTEQITEKMMQLLNPRGAICIIEAEHYCMRMRGCNQQESKMITSSVKGIFEYDAGAKQEFLTLIKGV